MKREIVRSLELCSDLFPQYYNRGSRPYHFAFLFKKGDFISFGVNGYEANAKTLKMGLTFNIRKYKKYKFPHAETDAISKVWGKTRLDNKCLMCIIRLNRFGKLQDSKPCNDCQVILTSIGINKVWWSEKNNSITNGVETHENVLSG